MRGDYNGRWTTSTCFMCWFLGFMVGFLACHELYAGKNDLTTPVMPVYSDE